MVATSEERRMLVSPAEAAKLLCISPRSLWTLTNRGEVPFIRVGKLTRYLINDIEDYVEQRRVKR